MEDGQWLYRDATNLGRENMLGAEVPDQQLKSNQMRVNRQDKLMSGPSAKQSSDTML